MVEVQVLGGGRVELGRVMRVEAWEKEDACYRVQAPLGVPPQRRVVPRAHCIRLFLLNHPDQLVTGSTAGVCLLQMLSQHPKSTKMKKRKTRLEDDDYIEADLKWFKDKQSAQSDVHGAQAQWPAKAAPAELLSTGGPSTTALPDESPTRARSPSHSPSILLQQVLQAKTRLPTLTASEAHASPSTSAHKRAFAKQKGRGKGPPGFKEPPIPVGQSQGTGESVRGDVLVDVSSGMEVASLHAEQTLSSILTTDLPSSVSPFAHNLIRVLSLRRGHSSSQPTRVPLTLAVELTAAEVAQVERWKARDTTSE